MNLNELSNFLADYPRDQVVPEGFAKPHSYRGYYDCLAFEPASNVTVGSMRDACDEARGATYTGWKGGEYTMHGDTAVYLAARGECQPDDEELSFGELRRMLSTAVAAPAPTIAVETLDRRIQAWLVEVYGKPDRDGASEFNDAASHALLTVVGLHQIRFTGTSEHGFASCVECGGARDEPPYCDTLAGIARSLGIELDPAASPPAAETREATDA